MNKEIKAKWLYSFNRLSEETSADQRSSTIFEGQTQKSEGRSLKSDVWLITGISGQDGSLFADYLLELGYNNIHGIIRRSATFNTTNIDHIFDKLVLHYGDLTDSMNIYNIIEKVQPTYIVNFAAQSHVKTSQSLENYTFQVNTMGILNILQSVKSLGLATRCKLYHASTSEMYGNQTDGGVLLNESSRMEPVSIYGISKKAAHDICNMYRGAYNMFIVSSILFNHESPRRGNTFVTKKITNYVAMYYHTYKHRAQSTQISDTEPSTPVRPPKTLDPLQLGNLNAKRDWGDAREHVKSIYLMLMKDVPQNYVIATGETHSVREFVELAFQCININIKWRGSGNKEIGVVNDDESRVIVQTNPKYYRDIDIDCLIGDSSRAKQELGWVYSLEFKNLVKDMVNDSIQKHENLYQKL